MRLIMELSSFFAELLFKRCCELQNSRVPRDTIPNSLVACLGKNGRINLQFSDDLFPFESVIWN